MEFSEVIRARHSARDFLPTPVPSEVLERVLRQATLSPSWSNTNPYRIAIAQGKTLETLREVLYRRFLKSQKLQRAKMPQQLLALLTKSEAIPDGDFKPVVNYPKDLQPRRVECGMGLYGVLGIDRKDFKRRDSQMAENFRFFGAPLAIFVFVHKDVGVYSALDAGIYLQSLMLAATNEGLATCAQGALGLYRRPLDAHFDVPPQYKLLCGVAMGYESDAPVNRFQPSKISVEELSLKPKQSA